MHASLEKRPAPAILVKVSAFLSLPLVLLMAIGQPGVRDGKIYPDCVYGEAK
jgi:hypothetical protein